MKKVGLIIWYGSPNYGTNIVAYALTKAIINIGCEPYIQLHDRKYGLKDLPIVIRKVCKKIQFKLKNKKSKRIISENKRKNIDNWYIPENPKFYSISSKEKIKQAENEIDVFLAGSDQLWNPNVFNETYFMDYLSKKTNKASYGTSIGTNHIPKRLVKKYKKYLNEFSYITVREETGAHVLSSILDKRISVVLDPTMLLNRNSWIEYGTYCDKSMLLPDKYIFVYFVANRDNYWKVILEAKNTLNLPIVFFSESDFVPNIEAIVVKDAGSHEFIKAISNASYVITDSFHACVLSINLEIQFSLVKRFEDNDVNSQNSRLTDIFKLLEIDKDFEESFSISNINYDKVRIKLEKERCESLALLNQICMINKRNE